MQRAGSTPRRVDQLHLAGGGQIEAAALVDDTVRTTAGCGSGLSA